VTNQGFLFKKSERYLRAVTLLMILACVVYWRPAKGQNRLDVPSFSARAITIYGGKQVRSPDKKAKVHLESLRAHSADSPGNFPARLIVEADGERLIATVGFALDAEIIWSPDSRAFSLTGSVEGANGQYRTDVFLIQSGKLVSLHLTDIIAKQFGHPVRCGWPELPNIAAVKWLTPSRQLLVASEIIHHSNCDSFGTFKAYAVDLEQEPRITKVYDQLQVKRLFRGDLGEELLQADDNCIREPKSCRIASNWKRAP
jgi:hypothetical protein